MLKIQNTEISGLERAKKSAGLPKHIGELSTLEKPKCINNLGSAKSGSGHDCFLKGIIVHHNITADHSFWMQWTRYHFHDIVSSQSKMHCILNGDFNFDVRVTNPSITEFNRLRKKCIDENTKENFETLIMNTPMGLSLSAECVTNYLQLKTIYNQRKTHKMSSWIQYCQWIAELPEFKIITGIV